jgi:hypothetical protein
MRSHAEQARIATSKAAQWRTLADLSRGRMMTPSLHMIARSLQSFLLAIILAAPASAAAAELQVGGTYPLTFRDVDGRDLSTAAGHVTIITVITREQEENARTVSKLVPERCIGDPKYRYITLVNFQRNFRVRCTESLGRDPKSAGW